MNVQGLDSEYVLEGLHAWNSPPSLIQTLEPLPSGKEEGA